MTLHVEDLCVRYPGGRRALDGVSLSVGTGETIAVVGGSGSGKSTLVKAVLGLLPAGAHVSGSITLSDPVGEVDVRQLRPSELRRLRGLRIGYVGQDPYGSVDPWWSVGHHVAEAWRVHRLHPEPDEMVARVAALGVADPRRWLRRRPSTWSGGMLQRADIVAATAHAPELMVADEPTSALDAGPARAVLAALVARSRSLLLVSHDLELVAEHADRVVVVDSGRVVDVVGRPVSIGALGGSGRHPATRRLVDAASGVIPTARPTSLRGREVASLEGVTLAYGDGPPVAAGLDLRVARGEIVGICGPSGAGKSSLLHALAGLLRPVAGSVRHGDRLLWSPDDPGPRRGYVMPVFQDSAASLDPRWPIWKSVAEIVAAAGDGTGRLGAPDVRARTAELLRDVGLSDVDPGSRPRQLSGGQRQRVAIARVVAGDPELVVADEPTAALDSVHAAEIARVLRGVADRGCGMVVVSHDERRLRTFADRVVRLADGRLRGPL